MPFPEGMQFILVELVLVVKFVICFFLFGYESSIFTKFDKNLILTKIIKKGFEHLCYICGFQDMIFSSYRHNKIVYSFLGI